MAKGYLAAFTTTLLCLLCAIAILAACNDDPGEMQVRGQVVEVIPRNFSELELLRIRDDSGREYLFETEGFAGFTPSHVREHQLLGQTLLVVYVKRGERLIMVRLED